jgi:prophage antirepressor-like protein
MGKAKNKRNDKDVAVFTNDLFAVEVRTAEDDGYIKFKLDGIVRSLGFTDTKKGVEYVRWARVRQYLTECGLSPELEKDDFIPEPYVYLLAMKAKSEIALSFQKWLAFEVIPAIRKRGVYVAENADPEVVNKELLFSPRRVRKTFAQSQPHSIQDLYSDMVEYITENYSNKERRVILSTACLGLEDLHNKLALDPAHNMGKVYELMLVKEFLYQDLLKLTKRSYGGKLGYKTRKLTQQQAVIESQGELLKLLPPTPEEYVKINRHGFSANFMYVQGTKRGNNVPKRSSGYNHWQDTFPYGELPGKSSWGVNWNKPLAVYLRFICREEFDTDNLIKSALDTIITRFYGEDDNIVGKVYAERVAICDDWDNGKIFFCIKNMEAA